MRKLIPWFYLLGLPVTGVAAVTTEEPTEVSAESPDSDEKNTTKKKSKKTPQKEVDAEQPHQLEEVVVESEPLERTIGSLARPVSVLKDAELRQQMGPTIGATLTQEPGINSQSFGPGVGQPVIRGLAGPRVRIMENGIGNNDVSNISPDHANSIEPSQAERIEILRGPSTLLYGSGAIGGVVNVIDNRVPEKKAEKPIGGALNQI
jgi:iron complex outermembrane receptor protein